MASNLDPSILAQFQARNSGGSGGTNYTGSTWIDTPEWRYEPMYQQQAGAGDDYNPPQVVGYSRYKLPGGADPYGYKQNVGDLYESYDPQGMYQGQHAVRDTGSGMDLLGYGVLAALSMGYGLPAMMGSGAGAAGGGAGFMGPLTAAETAAAAAPLEAALAPSLVSGATAGAGGGGFLSSLGGGGGIGSSLGKAGLSSIISGLGGGGGGGSGGGTAGGGGTGLNLGGVDLGSLIGGGVDYYNQNRASGDLLNWLKERTAITDNLYKPGTPEHALMQQEMERKDAAAGRNSQYGTRAVDLAAKIAQIKAAENTRLTTGIGNIMKSGLDQRASAPAGLMAALGGQSGIQNLSSLLGAGGSGLSSVIAALGGGDYGTNVSNIDWGGDFTFPDAGEGDWGIDPNTIDWGSY